MEEEAEGISGEIWMEEVAEMDWVGRSKEEVRMGLEEETMEVGRTTSGLGASPESKNLGMISVCTHLIASVSRRRSLQTRPDLLPLISDEQDETKKKLWWWMQTRHSTSQQHVQVTSPNTA